MWSIPHPHESYPCAYSLAEAAILLNILYFHSERGAYGSQPYNISLVSEEKKEGRRHPNLPLQDVTDD